MRNPNRNAKALAILSAAAGLALSSQFVSAAPSDDTWIPGTTGNWSTPGNWQGGAAPLAGVNLKLTFPGTGAGYTATNDVASGVGLFDQLFVNNAGAGNIVLTGQAINNTGAASGTNSGVLVNNSGAGFADFNLSGSTLYSFRVNQGTARITGGTWNLTSTNRRNDLIPPGQNDGQWSMNVGETTGQFAGFVQSGGQITAKQGFVAVGTAGSDGVGAATFTGAGTTATFDPVVANALGRFGISAGNGSINILNGAVVTCRLGEIARAGSTQSVLTNAVLNVSGTGSLFDMSQQLVLCRSWNNTATATVSAGAMVRVAGNAFIGTGELTAVGDVLPNDASFTVTDGAFPLLTTAPATGGQQTIGTGGNGTLILNNSSSGCRNTFVGNGGQVDAINGDHGIGTLIMNGTSTYQNRAQWLIESQAGPSLFQINGGTFSMDGSDFTTAAANGTFVNAFTCTNPGDRAIMRITGSSSAFIQSGASTTTIIGGGTDGGISTIDIQSGGRMLMGTDNTRQSVMSVAATPGAQATLTVNGAGSRLTMGNNSGSGDFIISDDTNSLVSGRQNTATVAVTGGGTVLVNRSLFIATASTNGSDFPNPGSSHGTLTIDGAGSKVTSNGGFFLSGAYATSLGDPIPGGKAIMNVLNGGEAVGGAVGIGNNPAGSDAESGQSTITVSGTNSKLTTNGFGMTVGDSSNGTLIVASGGAVNMGTGTAQLVVGWDAKGFASVNAGTLSTTGAAFLGINTGGLGNGTINVTNGTLITGGGIQIGGAGGVVGSSSVVNLTNSTLNAAGGIAVYQNSTLTIGSTANSGADTDVDGWIQYNSGTFNTTGTLTVAGRVQLSDAGRGVNGTPTNKKTLVAGKLDFTTSGIIDLNDNDALIHNNTLAEVENFVRTGRNGGLWTGTMITSTAAKNNGLKHTGLGVIRGSEYKAGNGGTTSFNGRALVNSDVVVKYTFNGDTELNGTVNGADYARVDTTFNNEISQGNIGGWFNGDFDYNGKVDGADYALIDAAFNQQGTVVLSRPGEGTLAGPESVNFDTLGMRGVAPEQVGDASVAHWDRSLRNQIAQMDQQVDGAVSGPAGSVVPEPSMLGLVGVSMLGALARRRRSR